MCVLTHMEKGSGKLPLGGNFPIPNQVVDDRSIGLPMLRPMHRPMPSADGTIGFFQTIGRWISLKKHRFSEKMAERNLV